MSASSVSERLALATALLAYGLVAGTVSLVILVAGIWVAAGLRGQADSLVTSADDAAASVEAVAGTIDATGSTTTGLGTSMHQATTALDGAASTLAATAQALRSTAAAADGVSLLGAQPLAAFAGSLQDTAARVAGLRADLQGIGASVAAAQPGVDALPARLADLSDRLRQVGSGMHAAAVGLRDGLTGLMVWLVLALTLATALPAAGAAVAGGWLRRQ